MLQIDGAFLISRLFLKILIIQLLNKIGCTIKKSVNSLSDDIM